MEIKDLHLTESLKEARASLKDISGIYCVLNNSTGQIYLGSSIDLYNRILDHVTGNCSNLYLQRAILKYGLATFSFLVIEQCAKDQLLIREQYWLDWLFEKPENLLSPPLWGGKRGYNFASVAGSCTGVLRSPETRALISDLKKGDKNPRATGVKVTDLSGNIVAEFSTMKVAATWLGVSLNTVSRAIRRDNLIKDQYRVSASNNKKE